MESIYRVYIVCYDYDSPIVHSDYTIGIFTDREQAYDLANKYANNKDELKDGLSSILCKYDVDKFDDFEIHFEEMYVNKVFGKGRADYEVLSVDEVLSMEYQEQLELEEFGEDEFFGEEE